MVQVFWHLSCELLLDSGLSSGSSGSSASELFLHSFPACPHTSSLQTTAFPAPAAAGTAGGTLCVSQALCTEVSQLRSVPLCCQLQGLALLFSSFSSLSSHMLSPGSLGCLSSNALSWRYWAQAFAAVSAHTFFSSSWIVCSSLYAFSPPSEMSFTASRCCWKSETSFSFSKSCVV